MSVIQSVGAHPARWVMNRAARTKENGMMRRLITLLLLGMLLSLSAASVASASDGPIGGCPSKFELHRAMDHDGDPSHKHVGTDTDRNGDGWICIKHVSADGNIHLHIDNNVPLR